MQELSYPKTKEQWWALVDLHWDDLYEICGMFLPLSNRVNCWEMKTPTTMGENIREAREKRWPDLEKYLNGAWWKSPDDPSIHSIPSWGVLCDLCSEAYLLYDEDKSEEENVADSAEFMEELLGNFPFTEEFKSQKEEELTPDWMRE